MARIIIVEGVNTAGKTVVQEKLKHALELLRYTVEIVPEKVLLQTFLPEEMTPQKSKELLKKIIEKQLAKKKDIILMDRSHFSNIRYLNTSFKVFEEIDVLLANHKAKIIALVFDPKTGAQRMRDALQYRKDTGFKEYMNSLIKEATTIAEENAILIKDCSKNIKRLKELLAETNIKNVTLDVTTIKHKEEYNQIIPKIIEFISS